MYVKPLGLEVVANVAEICDGLPGTTVYNDIPTGLKKGHGGGTPRHGGMRTVEGWGPNADIRRRASERMPETETSQPA